MAHLLLKQAASPQLPRGRVAGPHPFGGIPAMRIRIRGAATAAGVLMLSLLAPALAHAEDVLDKGDTA